MQTIRAFVVNVDWIANFNVVVLVYKYNTWYM
jgi:hypothetical protein